MTITPAMWQRMPWHPRAQAVAALDREYRALTQAVAALDREYRALTRSLGVLRQLAAGTDATGWDPTEPWTEETARVGHAAYVNGRRDLWACEGERAYQREAKRRQRAQRAEKAAS